MRTLADWLAYIERQHPKTIALGLDRVSAVYGKLATPLACPAITVGGTNGKGSTCAMLEAMLRAGGYRTALYTSPHLAAYNERVRIAGAEASDEALCESFAAVEAARGEVPLTYFEYGTLAALWLFAKEQAEAAILEVGLGGRLDAVNVVDADCAVLTSVGIDHVDYLGPDRESIGREKAGIFRAGRPAVIAEPDPPRSVLSAPGRHLLLGRDFGYLEQQAQWTYWGPGGRRSSLAHPALRGSIQLRNAAAAICALDSLREPLPLAAQDVRRGLAEVALPGRFQVLPGRPQVILDVAHNPQAAKVLAENLAASGFAPETIAVCGMLRDKDIGGVLRELASRVTRWHLASLPGARGAAANELAGHLASRNAQCFSSPREAFTAALGRASENDKIVVFGSFLTVGEVMGWLKNNKTSKR
ncbi:MAG TPA: bifunctional tetrahydrofolate synthase/dihydrofolate synthase [Burkholderiales bacterium]|nr:bifunctional tetrahydrofolate synthase/dihydrofolate synthase [Burkholderiales bacterium]